MLIVNLYLFQSDFDLPLRRVIGGDDLLVLPLDHLALVNKGSPVDGCRSDLSPKLDLVALDAQVAPRVVQFQDYRDNLMRLEAVSLQDKFNLRDAFVHEQGCCQLVLFD